MLIKIFEFGYLLAIHRAAHGLRVRVDMAGLFTSLHPHVRDAQERVTKCHPKIPSINTEPVLRRDALKYMSGKILKYNLPLVMLLDYRHIHILKAA